METENAWTPENTTDIASHEADSVLESCAPAGAAAPACAAAPPCAAAPACAAAHATVPGAPHPLGKAHVWTSGMG